MANFGEAILAKSKYQKHPLVIFDSVAEPGKRYEFYRNTSYTNDDGVETVYYCCVGCKKMKAAKIPKITVRNGQLLTNPDAPANSAHSCTPIEIAKSEAVQLDREVRSQIRDGRKRPLEAFREVEGQIHQKFARFDETTRGAIEQHFPDFKKVLRVYNKIASNSRPKLQDWSDAQNPPYCLTIRGRDANEADSFYGERNGVKVRGCLFHFTKAVYSYAAELGLSGAYKDLNSATRRLMRCLFGSALLPPDVAQPFLARLLAEVPDYPQLRQFVDYFRKQWMNNHLWNQHQNNGPRTTNHAEGFHSGLRSKFRHRHPSLEEFLMELQSIENSYARRIRKLRDGAAFPKSRRPQDIWIDEQIYNEKEALDRFLHLNGDNVQDNQIFKRLVKFCLDMSDFMANHDKSGINEENVVV